MMPKAEHHALPPPDCPDCGYSLRGLGRGSVACPECGRGFDVVALQAVQRTEDRDVPGVSDWRVSTILLVLLVLAVPICVPILMETEVGSPKILTASLVLTGVCLGYVFWTADALFDFSDRYTGFLAVALHLTSAVSVLAIISVGLALGSKRLEVSGIRWIDLPRLNRPPIVTLLVGVFVVGRLCRWWVMRALRAHWLRRVARTD